MTARNRKPGASTIRMSRSAVRMRPPGRRKAGGRARRVHIEREPDVIIEAADGATIPMGRRRRIPWGGLFLGSVFALLMLALTLWAEGLVRDLFALAPWLGWFGLGLALIALVAFIVLLARELSGLLRERRIEDLRERAARALADDDADLARSVAHQLAELYVPASGYGQGGGPRLSVWPMQFSRRATASWSPNAPCWRSTTDGRGGRSRKWPGGSRW